MVFGLAIIKTCIALTDDMLSIANLALAYQMTVLLLSVVSRVMTTELARFGSLKSLPNRTCGIKMVQHWWVLIMRDSLIKGFLRYLVMRLQLLLERFSTMTIVVRLSYSIVTLVEFGSNGL